MTTIITYNTSYLLISFGTNDNRMVSSECNISQLNDVITINDKFLNNSIQLDYNSVIGEVSALSLFNKLMIWRNNISIDINQYARIIQSDATHTYIAEAIPGTLANSAAWRVKKIVTATGTTTWADGNSNFDNIATNLTGLTYA